MDALHGLMAATFKATSRKVSCMAADSMFGKMGGDMRANTNITRSKEWAPTLTQMAASIKVSGKMVNSMEEGASLTLNKVMNVMVSGRKAKLFNGCISQRKRTDNELVLRS